ncbi:MAG TPA: peptidoglycan -binding protein [Alphaproteobacteria bacterium]|nr:peptidoglycan -binding protein [Alphaproteobacteria bacterium]
MPLARRSKLRDANVWPGFVDALTSLILAIIFVLLIFTIAQFTLSEVLSGRDAALKRLNHQVEELADMLNLERKANADLRLSVAQLSAELQSSTLKRDTLSARLSELSSERDKLTEQLSAANSEAGQAKSQLAEALKTIEGDKATLDEKSQELAKLEQDIAVLRSLRQDLEAKVLQGQQALDAEKQVSSEAQKQVELLNRQLLALRDQLAAIQKALDASETQNKQKDVQIADLGKRLNVALAGKVEELARYRSEFFGRLREILGNRSDIRIVGDRFVFQSEVLFPTASADLSPDGRQTLSHLADSLKQIAAEIPPTIHWILEVDGYTDKRPISTPRFPSNWELSTARATAVVKFLAENGIPPEHLAAAGFGEYQPIDNGNTEAAYAKNRRIELKLTQR